MLVDNVHVRLVEQFKEAMAADGIMCSDPIIEDGKIHRFRVNGDKNGSLNGWYCFYPDGIPAGCYGSWKLGSKQTWCSKESRDMTPQERAEHHKRIEAMRQEREAIEVREHEEAAKRAQEIWGQAKPTESHPYLTTKQVKAYGIRENEGCLVIPAQDIEGNIHSLQFIQSDGKKTFLPGGAVSGHCCPIGAESDRIWIAEGYATGATIYEATHERVYVAFNAGNLRSVAEAIRRNYLQANIIIAGDNDQWTDGNPGINKAQEAAEAVGGTIMVPEFTNRGSSPTDWNDLYCLEGMAVVKEQLTKIGIPNIDLLSHNSLFSQDRKWPILAPEALHGIVGDIAATIGPHTEADIVTLITHTLSEFSAIIGGSAYTEIDGYRSPLVFWPVLVGATAKARKGTGEGRIERLYREVCPKWTRGEYRGSLSSGEGLVHAVRDLQLKLDKDGKEICIDNGVEDKRLYLVQSEFGAMLKIMRRDGNSLSGVMRDSWDGKDLCFMTKNNRISATKPHIVIAGHVTEEELLRQLSETDMANGFGNRFAWFMVKRANILPFGSNPPSEQMDYLGRTLRDAVDFATRAEEVTLDTGARQMWRDVYESLSEGKPGMCGALLARAEAQVRRLTALYTLLDGVVVSTDVHMQAALALWQYAEESVAWLYGGKLGDPVMDTILDAVRAAFDGLTDSQISDLFHRHVSAGRLSQAKGRLQALGLVSPIGVETNGRTSTKWYATAKKAKNAK